MIPSYFRIENLAIRTLYCARYATKGYSFVLLAISCYFQIKQFPADYETSIRIEEGITVNSQQVIEDLLEFIEHY